MKEEVLERKIYLNRDLVKKLEKIVMVYPGLNLSLIINEALEEWIRGPDLLKSNHNFFITDDSEIFGPVCKKR